MRKILVVEDEDSIREVIALNLRMAGYEVAEAGSAEQALVIGPDGTVQATLELSGQVLDFDSAGSYCALLTGSTLTIYTAGGLEEYARLDATQGARYAALSSDGSVLLADEQQAWMYIPG